MICLTGHLIALNGLIHGKYLEECLAHSRHSIILCYELLLFMGGVEGPGLRLRTYLQEGSEDPWRLYTVGTAGPNAGEKDATEHCQKVRQG